MNGPIWVTVEPTAAPVALVLTSAPESRALAPSGTPAYEASRIGHCLHPVAAPSAAFQQGK